MDKKYRQKLLEKLVKSNEGRALEDLINEKIVEIERETIKAEKIEEVYGSRIAVKKLKEILRILGFLKRSEEKEFAQYE